MLQLGSGFCGLIPPGGAAGGCGAEWRTGVQKSGPSGLPTIINVSMLPENAEFMAAKNGRRAQSRNEIRKLLKIALQRFSKSMSPIKLFNIRDQRDTN